MAKRIGNPDVDWYFTKATAWQEEFKALRAIACATGLTEELKWGHPCYTLAGKNVVLMHGFKDYCALLFHKGSLLKDTAGLLVQQTANVQVQRQLRFTSRAEIGKQSKLIDRYIREAAALEKEGRRAEFKKTAEFAMPEEFAAKLGSDAALKQAFEALTPGRQRAYLLHIGSAKQAKTREARIEKHLGRILSGKGLDD